MPFRFTSTLSLTLNGYSIRVTNTIAANSTKIEGKQMSIKSVMNHPSTLCLRTANSIPKIESVNLAPCLPTERTM